MPEDITPIRQQYLEIKRDYPNTILFFRLGDFYETFDEDAQLTASELDIVLTSRPIGKGLRAPLAGIPYHALENYLARLIEKGHHVAICEQVGDQPVKGIFPRKVVRVVTPGTITNPGSFPEIRTIIWHRFILDSNDSDRLKTAGIAYADITTGEFAVTELPLDSLASRAGPPSSGRNHLSRQSVGFGNDQDWTEGLAHLTPYPAWRFEPGKCQEILLIPFQYLHSGWLRSQTGDMESALPGRSCNTFKALNRIHSIC